MNTSRHHFFRVYLLFCVLAVLLQGTGFNCRAQQRAESETPRATPTSPQDQFSLETISVGNDAELITIFAAQRYLTSSENVEWIPLLSVLRDTLGDKDPQNDRLRYLWVLTYTRPTLKQRFFSAIPFIYTRVGNKTHSKDVPPPILDVSATDRDVWHKMFWIALQNVVLDSYGISVKAVTRSYQRNVSEYRNSHVLRALSLLSLYQRMRGPVGKLVQVGKCP